MKKKKEPKNDKLVTSPSTSGSYGTSTSSNITVESSDIEGDDSDSLIPDFHEDKAWSSKTTSTVYNDDHK